MATTTVIASGHEWGEYTLSDDGWDDDGPAEQVATLFHEACLSLGRHDITWTPQTNEVIGIAGFDGPQLDVDAMRDHVREVVDRRAEHYDEVTMDDLGDLTRFII